MWDICCRYDSSITPKYFTVYFLKHKGSLLHNYITVTKIRKKTLIEYTYLIIQSTDTIHISSVVPIMSCIAKKKIAFCPKFNLGSFSNLFHLLQFVTFLQFVFNDDDNLIKFFIMEKFKICKTSECSMMNPFELRHQLHQINIWPCFSFTCSLTHFFQTHMYIHIIGYFKANLRHHFMQAVSNLSNA